MKNIHFAVLSLFFLSACTTAQILYTAPSSNNIKEENNQFVYENDSLKIIYSFWEEQGVMSFIIENKLEIPIYIDWKKSAFISSKTKLDYYSEKEITKSKSASVSAPFLYNNNYDWNKWYPAVLGLSEGVAVKYKEERITFIPPHAMSERNTYKILPAIWINMDNAINENTGTKGKELTATKETATISFRNFLTYSTKESFDTEKYINNEFYISKVLQVGGGHLTSYENPKRFYLLLRSF